MVLIGIRFRYCFVVEFKYAYLNLTEPGLGGPTGPHMMQRKDGKRGTYYCPVEGWGQ